MEKYFNTNADAEGLSKRLLTFRQFLGPIGTLARRKTDPPWKISIEVLPLRRKTKWILWSRLTTELNHCRAAGNPGVKNRPVGSRQIPARNFVITRVKIGT